MQAKTRKRLGSFVLTLVLVGASLVGLWLYGLIKQGYPADPLADARAFYQSQPAYLQPRPFIGPIQGLADLSAKNCGQCHKAFYDEWRVSTHARAWLDDAQFQEELHKSAKAGKDVAWMCVNCHTPLENQLERLVLRLKGQRWDKPDYLKNPNYDRALQLEAITCATCHVRDGYVLGPWGDTKAPHPVRKAPELLNSDVCLQCHQATASFPEINLSCMFNTGQEFAASPYPKKGYRCQSCHMPEIERPLITNGLIKRKTRRHWFGGSLIPKKPEYAAELEPLKAHYPDGLALHWTNLPKTAIAGRKTILRFEISNAEAGHMLPTGDPERFLRVEAFAFTTDGTRLAEKKLRIGSIYRWSPKIELVSDNRLHPKEKRAYQLEFEVPLKAKSLKVSLQASKWRISQENFDYHKLAGRYVASRVFFDKQIEIPVTAAP